MKHSVRIAVLMFGLVGTFISVAVPQVPAPDGGPIITCPQGTTKCTGLPPVA
jgi:hypothetical protein